MQATTHAERLGLGSDTTGMMRRLLGTGLLAGLTGGLVMIAVMILAMGAAGMGYATPLNVGMASFVFTIAPPMSMLPRLVSMMGIHLPASAMAPLAVVAHGGHLSAATMKSLGGMLMGMHVPGATVTQMGLLMSGKATNSTMASLMSGLSPSARAAVMNAMPVSAGHVVVGLILHLAFAAFLGVSFAIIIGMAARMGVPGLRTSTGIVTAGVASGAIVYVIMRWGLLPAVNPLMAFVPQLAFFLSHLLFGLVVGFVLAVAFRRVGMTAPQNASR